VLAPATVDEMCAPQTVADAPGRSRGYGLGVAFYPRGERTLVGHAGSMPGFLAAVLVDRHTGVGGAVLANCYQGPDPVELAAKLVESVLEHEPPLPEPWSPATSVPPGVAELLGHWYWGSSPQVVTSRARWPGSLFVAETSPGATASRFEQVTADRWRGMTGAHAGEWLDVRRVGGVPDELVLSTYRLRRMPYADPPG
jgi:Beta-lactamase